MRVIIEWQCEICKDVQVSNTYSIHNMDYCKCGESAVDLEEGYYRCIGKVKELQIITAEQ